MITVALAAAEEAADAPVVGVPDDAVLGLLLLLALLPQAAASSAMAAAAPTLIGTGTRAGDELPIVIVPFRAATANGRRGSIRLHSAN